MRTTIAIATFLAVGAGVAGVGAATLVLKGSDTIKQTTVNLLHSSSDCGGVGNPVVGTLDYEGTGSGNGQQAVVGSSLAGTNAGLQYVTPMSRMFNNGAGICTLPVATLNKAEGIVFELDGISILAKKTSAVACNGTVHPDCTLESKGVKFSGPLNGTPTATACTTTADCTAPDVCANSVCTTPGPVGRSCTAATDCDAGDVCSATGICVHGCGSDADCNSAARGEFGETCVAGLCSYSADSGAQGWKETLRILFFGISDRAPASGSTALSHRNCRSDERAYLADHYYKIFQDACTGTCTKLQHLFRRDDESGTTDVFVGSLNVTAIDQANNLSPFCNVATQGPPVTQSCTTLASPAVGTECQNAVSGKGDCIAINSANAVAGLHCDYRKRCASDADCGATAPVCTGDATQCRGVAPKTCNKEDTGASTVTRCMASRLFMACNTDADCGAGLTGSCVADKGAGTTAGTPASPTGKICIRGNSGQQPASDLDVFLPQPGAPDGAGGLVGEAGRPRLPVTTIIALTDRAAGLRGEYFVDRQDGDPIRRTCARSGATPQEDVCSLRGDLGLELAVVDAPVGVGTPPLPQFPDVFPGGPTAATTQTCSTGKFSCSQSAVRLDGNVAAQAVFQMCPDGSNPNKAAGTSVPGDTASLCGIGKCPVPVFQPAGAAADLRCVNGRTNTSSQQAPINGLVYNLTGFTGTPAAGFNKIRVDRGTGLNLNNSQMATVVPVNLVNAFFRIHMQHSIATPLATCQQIGGATEQIGCLVQASPCASGYAGNSAADIIPTGAAVGDAFALKINQIDPQNLCVQNLLLKPAGDPQIYRIARKLYLNAVDGFESLTGTGSHVADPNAADQFKMAKCFAAAIPVDNTLSSVAGQIANGLGFVPLPAAKLSSVCEDFREDTVCGVANVDACAGNPAPIPDHP